MLWRQPVELLKQLNRSSLLAFEPVRVYRIEQAHWHALHHFIQHAHAAIEVSFQLACDRAVVERLRQFAPGNLPFGNEHQTAHSTACRVGGHRR